MKRIIRPEMLNLFVSQLIENEKSEATIEKYSRDIKNFISFSTNRNIDKSVTLSYKAKLKQDYAIASANSMIAALNSFLRFLGWYDCCIKQFKVQKQTYCTEEKELTKEEYVRLVKAAQQSSNERLSLIIQTICASGIRVSELEQITVESVRTGKALVSCKGKSRTVFIVRELQRKLLSFAKAQGIIAGPVFVTKTGKPISRCNIWREMKALCLKADVAPSKVFPHNLRHLFARIFYNMEKDIAKLADILGHSSINTTRIYIITTGAEHRRKIEKMHLII